jgi:hypothetical protein
VVDGIVTDFLDINRGVPQGTVIGPFLFSLMVNDINLEDPESNTLLSKAASRMYILRVCRCYGYTKKNLNLLFETLILSLFHYGIEVCGSALQNKYLQRIDKFLRRAYRFGYTLKEYKIRNWLRRKTNNYLQKL